MAWRPAMRPPSTGNAALGRLKRRGPLTWCRRPNGFSDNPKWRAVSARSRIDLCVVLAFVNRLEELGNDAVNRGEIRGTITGFAAEDFAAALNISSENARLLMRTLEHPEIGWIADGMIVDFYDRHPETEDPTATERQRRKRSRDKILRELSDCTTRGLISAAQRLDIEKELPQLNHAELVNLHVWLQKTILGIESPIIRDSRLSHSAIISGLANIIGLPQKGAIEPHNVVTRDNVTVTIDQNKNEQAELSPASTVISDELVSSQENEAGSGDTLVADPEIWLEGEGVKLVMNRVGWGHEVATTRLLRWTAQIQDSAVLVKILKGASHRNGVSFHNEVTDQINRLSNKSLAPRS